MTTDEAFKDLRNKLRELTIERDAWHESNNDQVAKLIEIANERDELKSTLNAASISAASQEFEINELLIQVQELKAAGKLALGVLLASRHPAHADASDVVRDSAIVALKKARIK